MGLVGDTPFGFRVYKLLARCTTAYGGVNHSVTVLSPTYDDTRPLIGQLPGCTISYARVKLVYPGKPLTTQ